MPLSPFLSCPGPSFSVLSLSAWRSVSRILGWRSGARPVLITGTRPFPIPLSLCSTGKMVCFARSRCSVNSVLLQFSPFGGTSPGRMRPGCQTWMHSSHSLCVCTCAIREQAVSWEGDEGGGGKCCLPLDILIRWPFYNGSRNSGLYRHATLCRRRADAVFIGQEGRNGCGTSFFGTD